MNHSTKEAVLPGLIGDTLHGQLFRNIVFASKMAREIPWHVVNPVSSTQCLGKDNTRYSFADPTEAVRGYLHPDWKHCFTYRTWEKLHATMIRGNSALAVLDRYLRGKSAHYLPAFALN